MTSEYEVGSCPGTVLFMNTETFFNLAEQMALGFIRLWNKVYIYSHKATTDCLVRSLPASRVGSIL
jgi:hypothetical protein